MFDIKFNSPKVGLFLQILIAQHMKNKNKLKKYIKIKIVTLIKRIMHNTELVSNTRQYDALTSIVIMMSGLIYSAHTFHHDMHIGYVMRVFI